MDEYIINQAPDQLHPDAKRGWTTETTASPAPGDIWLLSWDGEGQGLVLVTAVHPDFILGIPVTLGTEYASQNEALLDPSVLGTPATAWFNAETGLGMFLLHRRVVADAVPAVEVAAYRRASKVDERAPFPVGTSVSVDTAEFRQELLTQFQSLCFLEWPEPIPGEGTLDTDTVQALGVNAKQFVETSGLPVEVAYEVWIGQRTIPEDIADQLAENLGLSAADLLKASPDDAVRRLEAPLLKELIFLVSSETGRSERDIRNAARSSYALAARTTTVTGREITALTDALNALRTSPEQ